MTTMRVDLPYLVEDRGMIYVRRYGRKIRLRARPGTPEFAAAYNTALDALASPMTGAKPISGPPQPKGTWGWLAGRYFVSDEFLGLAAKSQATRRSIIEQCLAERIRPDSPKRMREVPVDRIDASHVKALRDRKGDKKGAANNRKKYLSAMFGWAVEAGHMTRNPARDVRRKKYATSGFYTWTMADVDQFESRHPVGSKARLALALLMFTGARRQDVVTFGRQHIKSGWLRYVPKKTLYRRKTVSEKPVLPILADAIAAGPSGNMTFLVTEYGKPFTAAGFGGWFRDRCDEAGLPQCTAHGLKKAGASRAAENGATGPQLMALFDWTTLAQAHPYIEAANRKRMAGESMHLIVGKTGTDETLSDAQIVSSEKKAG